MEQMYKQCSMTRKTKDSTKHTVSFIPAEFATVGNYLKLKEDGVWENGWQVTGVGATRTLTQVVDAQKDGKRMVRKDMPRNRSGGTRDTDILDDSIV